MRIAKLIFMLTTIIFVCSCRKVEHVIHISDNQNTIVYVKCECEQQLIAPKEVVLDTQVRGLK